MMTQVRALAWQQAVKASRTPAIWVAVVGHVLALSLYVVAWGDGVSLVGPYQLFGTRSDDANDVVPHEHRRELRGLQVFAAWLNHARMDALHTYDIVVQPPGQPPHIRHYLFDFMATLGSGMNGPKAVWEGRDPLYGQGAALRNISALGVYTPLLPVPASAL